MVVSQQVVEQLLGLNKGDAIENVTLFPGLCDERITWSVLGAGIQKDAYVIEFSGSYMGVFMFNARAVVKDNGALSLEVLK